MDANRLKYTFEVAHLTDDTFSTLISALKSLFPHYYDLLDEAYNHRDLSIVRIQRLIDEKSVVIMQESGQTSIKPTIYHHNITITQTVGEENNDNTLPME